MNVSKGDSRCAFGQIRNIFGDLGRYYLLKCNLSGGYTFVRLSEIFDVTLDTTRLLQDSQKVCIHAAADCRNPPQSRFGMLA